MLPFGGVLVLISESDDRLVVCDWVTILTGEVELLTAWPGGDEGSKVSSGTGELKAKLNADWPLVERKGGAEGGGDTVDILRTGLEGGVTLWWVCL